MEIQQGTCRKLEHPLPPQEGYDLAAPWYDSWHWTQLWQRNEMPLVAAIFERLTPGQVLDAGSGTGAYRFQLEARGHEVVALDISRKMLAVQALKERFSVADVKGRLVNGDIRAMPEEWSATFDYIVCARVLSHVENSFLAISELSRVLKKGGRLVITDVDPGHPYTHVKIRNGSLHSMIRVYKHDHQELKGAFAEAGLRIQMLRQVRLDELVWQPPREAFAKIYRAPEKPIFFVCELAKLS